jgi:hypothetical protein
MLFQFLKQKINNYVNFSNIDTNLGNIFNDPELSKEILQLSFIHKKYTHLLMLMLAGVIYLYESPDLIEEIMLKHFNLTKDTYKIVNVEGKLIFGVFKIKDHTVFSFKGSSDFFDFITDIRFLECHPEHNIPGKTHSGFASVLFDNINDDIHIPRINKVLTEIDIIDNIQTPVYFTSHSLGSGISTILWSYLKNNDEYSHLNIKNITFGCPRVGNFKFSKTIKNTIRFVNKNDIVPNLPLPIGYTHTMEKIQLGVYNYFRFWSIKDHFIKSYFENLKLSL